MVRYDGLVSEHSLPVTPSSRNALVLLVESLTKMCFELYLYIFIYVRNQNIHEYSNKTYN